jgi:hypothetical protein
MMCCIDLSILCIRGDGLETELAVQEVARQVDQGSDSDCQAKLQSITCCCDVEYLEESGSLCVYVC